MSTPQHSEEERAGLMKSEEHKARDFQLIHVPQREKYVMIIINVL